MTTATETHSENGNVPDDALATVCERALEAAVAHVPTLGWSREALEAACLDLDLPPGLHSIAMPRGPIDLVLHFYESRNHRLANMLAKWRQEDIASAGGCSKPTATKLNR